MAPAVLTLAAQPPGANPGSTAFVLVSAALVMVMTPGLAFFYGGMVRVRSALNMLMMSFVSLGIVSILWTLYGFSLAFGSGSGFIGGTHWLGLRSIGVDQLWPGTGVPVYAFAVFQLMFAVITPALISGALADRVKFTAWSLFVLLWATVVYLPVAHWVWAPDGWLFTRGVIDFAGGTAVHINAGAAALGVVLVIGRRRGFRRDPMRPHNLPLVMLGCGLLWFGWFGFNAGSRLNADGVAAVAFTNTQLATAAAMLGWLGYERLRHGSFTTLGAASGAVSGLVAITPACGSVSPLGAIALGLVTGPVCAAAVGLKYRFGYDDSLDVVAVHLVGGVIGSVLLGLFADASVNSAGKDGAFFGGGWGLFGEQVLAVAATFAFSFVVSGLIGLALKAALPKGIRVTAEEENRGLDLSQHAESAYALDRG